MALTPSRIRGRPEAHLWGVAPSHDAKRDDGLVRGVDVNEVPWVELAEPEEHGRPLIRMHMPADHSRTRLARLRAVLPPPRVREHLRSLQHPLAYAERIDTGRSPRSPGSPPERGQRPTQPAVEPEMVQRLPVERRDRVADHREPLRPTTAAYWRGWMAE